MAKLGTIKSVTSPKTFAGTVKEPLQQSLRGIDVTKDYSAQMMKEVGQEAPEVARQIQPEVQSIVGQMQPLTDPQQQSQQPQQQQDLTPQKMHELLMANDAAAKRMQQTTAAQPNQKDNDSEPYGYDASDKVSMLGTYFLGGYLGTADTAAAIGQKGAWLLEKTHLAKAGSSDEFTDWHNRWRNRNAIMFDDAHNAHPYIFGLGKFSGEIAAGSAAVGAALAALPEELTASAVGGAGVAALDATSGIATEAVEHAPALAKAASKVMDTIDTAIEKSMNDGAAKAILNSRTMATSYKAANMMLRGFLLGETNYSPTNNHYLSQGVGGAVGGLLAIPAAKGLGLLKSKFVNAIQAIESKYPNIQLPYHPKLEQVFKIIPLSGVKNALARRAASIQDEIGGFVKGAVKPANKAMYATLDDKESYLNRQLDGLTANPNVRPQNIDEMKSRIANVQDLKQKILKGEANTGNSYGRFMVGKRADEYAANQQKVGELNEKLDNTLPQDGVVDVPNAREVAKSIVDRENSIFEPLRKAPFLAISNSILGEENTVKDELVKLGLDTPEKLAPLLQKMSTGQRLGHEIGKALMPVRKDIEDVLDDVRRNPNDTDIMKASRSLLAQGGVTYESLRNILTRTGSRIGTISDVDGTYKWLYGSLSSDLRKYLVDRGDPEALNLYDEQAKLHSNKIIPFKKSALTPFRHDLANADNFFGQFLTPDNRQGVLETLSLMPKGDKATELATQAGVLSECWDRAEIPGIGHNVPKFLTELLGTPGKKASGMLRTLETTLPEDKLNALKGYRELINVIGKISPDALEPGITKGYSKGLSEGVSHLFKERSLAKGIGFGAAALGAGLGLMEYPGIIHMAPYIFASSAVFSRIMLSKAGRKLAGSLSKLGEKATDAQYAPIINKLLNMIVIPASAKAGAFEGEETR